MKGRGLFTLLAILTLALGVTGAAFAAPTASPALTGQETCPDGDGWTKIDSSDLSLYPVEGADEYCFKAGSDQSEGCIGGLFDAIPEGGFQGDYCGLSHWSYHMPEYQVCSETVAVYGEWSEWAVNPQDESQLVRSRTVTYVDSENREHVCDEATEYEYMDRPVCEWNPELYADDPECQPPPGGASATLAPFCGGGVNVTLANAVIYVQFADQDPVLIDENGSYPLDLGDYTAWAEADEGFEFPEGATTQWEFSVDRCPTRHEESPTGPLDSIPLSTALPIAASGLTGLALLGSALRRKRH